MWNKHKQLVALTAVAGLLALPALDSFAQSAPPFGKANPIQSLSEQLDSQNAQLGSLNALVLQLKDKVANLETIVTPTSTGIPMGLYSVHSTSYCIIASSFTSRPALGGGVLYTVPEGETSEIRHWETTSLERYIPTSDVRGRIEQTDRHSIMVRSTGFIVEDKQELNSDCSVDYFIGNPRSGYFTKGKNCTAGLWRGFVELAGRTFDQGKTLMLMTSVMAPEIWQAGNRQMYCTTKELARRIDF